jgi:RNA polymerase sigma factor (sigma-70 family)
VRGPAKSSNRVVEGGSTRAGIEALFEREYNPMFSLALAMLGNGSDADDVVQDAFVAVASRWETLENPGGYIRVSVVNGARKKMRTQIRRGSAETLMQADAKIRPDGQQEYLLDVLDRLPDRQRVAVVLTYFSGLDSREVGLLMGCRPATVRSQLRHALDQMREVVER